MGEWGGGDRPARRHSRALNLVSALPKYFSWDPTETYIPVHNQAFCALTHMNFLKSLTMLAVVFILSFGTVFLGDMSVSSRR